MAKKHKHPEHENLERWLVSYADFMTLLFATFTALYALSLSDVNKLKDVAQAISQGFEEQSILHGIQTILQGKSPPAKEPETVPTKKGQGSGVLDKYKSMTYKPGEIEAEKQLASKLTQDVQKLNTELKASGQAASLFAGTGSKAGEESSTPIEPAKVSIQERGIRISFDSRMLFPAGAATVRPEAYHFLDTVAARLKTYQNHVIHIEGHTDDLPITTAIYPSNWELSGSRASSIVRYFITHQQFNPASLVAVGYGDTQPVASNQTPEGRAKNRRVDIVIYGETASNMLNPRLQYLKEQPLEIKSDSPDKSPVVVPVLPSPPVKPAEGVKTGPVRVIIKEKDGTEKVLIPKTHQLLPVTGPDAKAPTKPGIPDIRETLKSGPIKHKTSAAAPSQKPAEPKPAKASTAPPVPPGNP